MQIQRIGTYTNQYSANKNQQPKDSTAFGTLELNGKGIFKAFNIKKNSKDFSKLSEFITKINNDMDDMIKSVYKILGLGEPQADLIREDKTVMNVTRVMYEYAPYGKPKFHLEFGISDNEIMESGDTINSYSSLIDAIKEATTNSVKKFIEAYITKNPERYLYKQSSPTANTGQVEKNILNRNSSTIGELLGESVPLNEKDSIPIKALLVGNEEIFFN